MDAEGAIRLINAINRTQDISSLQFWILYNKCDRVQAELDARRNQLKLRLKEVDQANESEKQNEMEMDLLELDKTAEKIVSIVEEVNRDRELSLKNIVEFTVEVVQEVLELQVFNDDDHAKIYEKRMEELDREQFMNVVKVKYGSADEEKAEELCSLWEGYLRDPSWHPYKVVVVGDKDKEVVDENDDKLKELKNEFGEEVYVVVTKALNKVYEVNPSANYPVWNSSKKRKAVFKEGVARLLNDWKIQRRKRKRN